MVKSTRAENPSGNPGCGGVGWINGHIMFDRDILGSTGRDFGISVGQDGTLAFGASVNDNNAAETACTSGVNLLDGVWHHVAAQRTISSGLLEIYVDGTRQANETGPSGDISLPAGTTGINRRLVIGAEKHDISNDFPSYEGLLDGFWAVVDFIQNSIVKSVAPRSAALFTSTGTMTRSLPGALTPLPPKRSDVAAAAAGGAPATDTRVTRSRAATPTAVGHHQRRPGPSKAAERTPGSYRHGWRSVRAVLCEATGPVWLRCPSSPGSTPPSIATTSAICNGW